MLQVCKYIKEYMYYVVYYFINTNNAPSKRMRAERAGRCANISVSVVKFLDHCKNIGKHYQNWLQGEPFSCLRKHSLQGTST
jgi:hypothetical protein